MKISIPLESINHINNPKKQKNQEQYSFEGSHKSIIVSVDWHVTSKKPPFVIVWLEETSQYALAGGEFAKATTESIIKTLKDAQQAAFDLNLQIMQIKTDSWIGFCSTKFRDYLESFRITHSPLEVKNPVANGMLERFWSQAYDKHRWEFKTLQEFLEWFNNKIHSKLLLGGGQL